MSLVSEVRAALSRLGVRWEPVSQADIDRLKAEFPDLPSDYADVLTRVGAGSLGGRFMLYGAPADPDEVYDPETAEELEGVVLFGDDFQGFCVGFVPSERWKVVEIDPTRPQPIQVANTFEEFMLKRMSKLGV